jgi:hypothetical protein
LKDQKKLTGEYQNCRGREPLDKAKGIIDQEACRVDGLADPKYFMNRWPAAPKKAAILYIVQPARGQP